MNADWISTILVPNGYYADGRLRVRGEGERPQNVCALRRESGAQLVRAGTSSRSTRIEHSSSGEPGPSHAARGKPAGGAALACARVDAQRRKTERIGHEAAGLKFQARHLRERAAGVAPTRRCSAASLPARLCSCMLTQSVARSRRLRAVAVWRALNRVSRSHATPLAPEQVNSAPARILGAEVCGSRCS